LVSERSYIRDYSYAWLRSRLNLWGADQIWVEYSPRSGRINAVIKAALGLDVCHNPPEYLTSIAEAGIPTFVVGYFCTPKVVARTWMASVTEVELWISSPHTGILSELAGVVINSDAPTGRAELENLFRRLRYCNCDSEVRGDVWRSRILWPWEYSVDHRRRMVTAMCDVDWVELCPSGRHITALVDTVRGEGGAPRCSPVLERLAGVLGVPLIYVTYKLKSISHVSTVRSRKIHEIDRYYVRFLNAESPIIQMSPSEYSRFLARLQRFRLLGRKCTNQFSLVELKL
jgi:hypothetical protein